jgi:hypothetical protein
MPLLAVYTKLYLAPYKLAAVVIGGAGGGSGTSLDFHINIDRFLLADPSHDGAVNGRLDAHAPSRVSLLRDGGNFCALKCFPLRCLVPVRSVHLVSANE